MNSSRSIRRFLSKFSRGTDNKEAEIDVDHIPLSVLQEIFDEPASEAMYASYDVDEQRARRLQPLISETLDTVRFEYFLEAESV